jgi:hypothetical protein
MGKKTFIRFFGMKRGGNHALHNWILPKFQGRIYYNNNALFKHPVDKKKSDGLNCFKKYSHITQGERDNNDIIFISYEDLALSDTIIHPPNIDQIYGHYDIYTDIFVLRDPYNLFASRARHYEKGTAHRSDLCVHKRDDFDRLVFLWKDFAYKFLNPQSGEVGIYYDKWYDNDHYRRRICESLGVEFNDKGKDLISGWGGGSSFDGAKVPAHKMKVLERKKQYKDYEFSCKLSEDQELNRLLGAINESLK